MLGVLGVCGLLPSPVHLGPSSGTAARVQRLPRGGARAAIEQPHARLILVRHGQSEWNRANRFTGWADVDLTEVGISDAREAGKLLAAEGLEVDEVHTSLMRRAVRSAVLMLSTLNQCWVPVRKHLQLNEQHSGSLTGINKRELAREKGEEQVMAWRRQYDAPPPAIAPDNALQLNILGDPRYEAYPGDIPSTESLADVCRRVWPLYEETILPSLQAGRTVLVVTHGNTLRALAMKIDGIKEEDIFYTDLPTATPLLYDFDKQLNHLRRHGAWGDRPSAPRHGRYLVSDERVRAAQLAMRQQVSQDIAYSGPTGVVEPAFTATEAGSEIAEIDGERYVTPTPRLEPSPGVA